MYSRPDQDYFYQPGMWGSASPFGYPGYTGVASSFGTPTGPFTGYAPSGFGYTTGYDATSPSGYPDRSSYYAAGQGYDAYTAGEGYGSYFHPRWVNT